MQSTFEVEVLGYLGKKGDVLEGRSPRDAIMQSQGGWLALQCQPSYVTSLLSLLAF